MHNAFLKNYFGDQPAIIDFAKTLIAVGRKDAAKALNEAVRVLGNGMDPIVVINRIKGKFGLFEYTTRTTPPPPPKVDPVQPPNTIHAGTLDSRAFRLSTAAAKPDATVDEVRNAIEALEGKFVTREEGCSVDVLGEAHYCSARSEVVAWFRDYLYPKLYFSPT